MDRNLKNYHLTTSFIVLKTDEIKILTLNESEWILTFVLPYCNIKTC